MLGEEDENSCLFPSLLFDLRLDTTSPQSIPSAFPPLASVGSSCGILCSGTMEAHILPGNGGMSELMDPVENDALLEVGVGVKVCCMDRMTLLALLL